MFRKPILKPLLTHPHHLLEGDITSMTPLTKGWSSDQKYKLITSSGESYLLRLSKIKKETAKTVTFHKMCQLQQMGLPINAPLELGYILGYIDEAPSLDTHQSNSPDLYMLLEWVDGDDAEDLMTQYSPQKQYDFGREAGHILRKINTLKAPDNLESWHDRYQAKIERKLKLNQSCPLSYDNESFFLESIQHLRHLTKDRPQSYQHGDFHIGNMMIDTKGQLQIIDFDRDDFGDPWDEFNRMNWCVRVSPSFSVGLIDGYFDNDVPTLFWKLFKLYTCVNTLSSLSWAIPFGQEQIDIMRQEAHTISKWYDDDPLKLIPSWYKKD